MRVLKNLFIAVVLMRLMSLLLPPSFARAHQVVTFSDPNLEAAIRQAICKPLM